MTIDLFSIEPCQLDAEERMAYLDALKLSDSPSCQGEVMFRVNVQFFARLGQGRRVYTGKVTLKALQENRVNLH